MSNRLLPATIGTKPTKKRSPSKKALTSGKQNAQQILEEIGVEVEGLSKNTVEMERQMMYTIVYLTLR